MSFKHVVFVSEFIDYLRELGFKDVKKEGDEIYFSNTNLDYNSKMINQFASQISDFINKKGFDSDDFIIRGSVIFFPKDFEDK